MKLGWVALSAVLALGSSPMVAHAQAATPKPKSEVEIPVRVAPVRVEAQRMPFAVGDAPNCSERGKVYKVTARVYNVLAQLVAVPTLQGSEPRPAAEQPLENVLLSCDEYTAYWDGKNASTGKTAAPGMYLYKLEVDGRPVQVKRVIIK